MEWNDQFLAYLELTNDLLFNKIPEGKYGYYVDHSIQAGKAAAARFLNRDIFDLYKENNISILYEETDGEFYKVRFRAQFFVDKNGKRVVIYKKSLNELSQGFGEQLTYDLALKIHLCHEFFHYIEDAEGIDVSQSLDEIVTFTLPFYKRKAHVSKASEIAAHTFVKEMLKLPQLPNYYDYVYLINNKQFSEARLMALKNEFEAKVR